jgi:peptide/nickel transport system substrate-binding protein
VFSSAGRTVTMTLNHYVWSARTPVTSLDVDFWMNMVIANKDNSTGTHTWRFP